MSFSPPKPQIIKRSTFSKERRFLEHFYLEKNSNVIIGPTSYDSLKSVLEQKKKPCLVNYVM